MQQRHRRRFRIIRPRLQLRLIGSFFGIAALALLLQYLAFLWMVADAAVDMPAVAAAVAANAAWVLAGSFALLLPLTLLVGVLMTHRIAGPVYRLETFLKQVESGEAREDCRLRKGDELQELCALVNQATAARRAHNGGEALKPEKSPSANAQDSNRRGQAA